jgi:hypothetical protein
MRSPEPGAVYRVVAQLTLGMADKEMQVLDTQEFDMTLEFRDPDARAPGFGVGVDWDSWRRQAEQQ